MKTPWRRRCHSSKTRSNFMREGWREYIAVLKNRQFSCLTDNAPLTSRGMNILKSGKNDLISRWHNMTSVSHMMRSFSCRILESMSIHSNVCYILPIMFELEMKNRMYRNVHLRITVSLKRSMHRKKRLDWQNWSPSFREILSTLNKLRIATKVHHVDVVTD